MMDKLHLLPEAAELSIDRNRWQRSDSRRRVPGHERRRVHFESIYDALTA
jgi:hypothetical protein